MDALSRTSPEKGQTMNAALETAVREMHAEQGMPCCDYCLQTARFEWQRTPAQIKKMSKRGKNAIPAARVSLRCQGHVPYFAPELAENYRDRTVSLAVAA
jgi:hypothetical protein